MPSVPTKPPIASPTGVRAAAASGAVTLGVPLMVSLEGVGAHELWPTLADRTADDLAALHAAHRTAEENR